MVLSPPQLPHQRPRWSSWLWGASLVAGALTLTCSIAAQRFMPVAKADPAAFVEAHKAWCTGELLGLRVELEEAMLQELAGAGDGDAMSRAEEVRRRSWDDRLQQVSLRCQHSDLAQNSALGLRELAKNYVGLVDQLLALRAGLAASVDNTLRHLKNDP